MQTGDLVGERFDLEPPSLARGQKSGSSRSIAFVLAALGFFFATPAAHADERNASRAALGCAPRVIAWVARADASIGASIQPVQCFPAHVRLQIKTANGGVMDVDISTESRGAFRRLGSIGVSPILEIDDFRQVPLAQREAFDALCTWIAEHPSEVVLDYVPDHPASPPLSPPRESLAFGHLWSRNTFAALVFLLVLVTIRAARKAMHSLAGRRDWFALFALWSSALALRLLFGPFGPHHVNGQGPMWVTRVASDGAALVGYGPGYVELFSFLCELFPKHPDTAIFAANAFLGAFAAPLVFALARKLGVDHARSLAAAALVVVDAVSIRFGATEAYFPSIIALTLGTAVLFISAVERTRTTQRLAAFFLATLGALLSAQAARIHPIAWGPVALGPVFVLAMDRAGTTLRTSGKLWARKITWSGGIALLVVLVLVTTSGREIVSVASGVHEHWDAHAGALRALAYLPLVAALLAGMVVLAKPRGPLVPMLASALALIATRWAYDQAPIWIASYDRLFLAAPIIAAATIIPASLAHARRAWLVLGAALALVFVRGWSTIHERTTEQLEYAFFRDAFSNLPAGCRVAHVPRVDRRIVALPDYAIEGPKDGRLSVVAVSSSNEVHRLLRPGACLRYAHTSLCTSTEGRPACAAVERGLELVPLVERTFPAKQSHVTSPYDRDVVQVVLFDVRGR